MTSGTSSTNIDQGLRALVLELSDLFKTDVRGGSWARKLKNIEQNTRGDDAALADKVLSNYGTMGAINDWSFSGLNSAERNERYQFLIAEIADRGAPLVASTLLQQKAILRGKIARRIAAAHAGKDL